MTSVWVASDSTNQPERNRAGTGVEAPQHDAEGDEVEYRADRAEEEHEPADEAHIPPAGGRHLLGIHLVGRDGQLARVIQQVVEQDLRGQHGQEGQEQRRPGGAEHVPEVAGRAHEHVFHGVGEDPPAAHDPVGEHVQVLFQQQHVGGVLGHIGSRVDRDPDISGVQRDRVVDPIAQEGHIHAGAALLAHQLGLVLRADPGEHRRPGEQVAQLVARLIDVGAGGHLPGGRPSSAQTFAATVALSPVRIFTVTPRPASRAAPRRRRLSAGRGTPGCRGSTDHARRPP